MNKQAFRALEAIAPKILGEKSLLRVIGLAALANSVDMWLPGRSASDLDLDGRMSYLAAERAETLLEGLGR